MKKLLLGLAIASALSMSMIGTARAGVSVSYQSGGGCAPPEPWYTYWPITAYFPPRTQPAFPFWPQPQQQVGMFPGWPNAEQRHQLAEPRPLFQPEVQRAVGYEPGYWPGR